jgi:hypothetical protein
VKGCEWFGLNCIRVAGELARRIQGANTASKLAGYTKKLAPVT